MKHNLVKWKPVKCKSRNGTDVSLGLPEIIEIRYRGLLLSNILTMPKKNSISFEKAIQMLSDIQVIAFNAGQFGEKSGQYGWYDKNFVSWISSLGYHIELSGDEFETYATTDKLI